MKQHTSPKIIAAAIAVVLVVWMLTGLLSRKDGKSSGKAPAGITQTLFRVRAVRSEASLITRESRVNARTEADRSATLRAEVSGQVVSIGAARGSMVKQGDLIASVEGRERASRVAQAEATLRELEMQYESTRNLAEKGLASQSQLASAESSVESARAALTGARLDLEKSSIVAPFDGALAMRAVEVGDYLSPGGEVAVVTDLDPIVVSGYMTEKEIAGVHTGTGATAKLSTGGEIAGTITFISPEADSQTRMYKVEMRAGNADFAIRSGLTAVLSVPHDKILAHFVSPASILLADDGRIGLLLADENGVTSFCPIELVQTEEGGIWVSGPPEKSVIVTIGKDFVSPGQKVEVVFETPVAR